VAGPSRLRARFVLERKVDVDRLFTHQWKLDQAEESLPPVSTPRPPGRGVFLM